MPASRSVLVSPARGSVPVKFRLAQPWITLGPYRDRRAAPRPEILGRARIGGGTPRFDASGAGGWRALGSAVELDTRDALDQQAQIR